MFGAARGPRLFLPANPYFPKITVLEKCEAAAM
jgi:hypothetical protein